MVVVGAKASLFHNLSFSQAARLRVTVPVPWVHARLRVRTPYFGYVAPITLGCVVLGFAG